MQVLHVVDEMPFLMGGDGFATISGDVLSILKQAGQAVLEEARMTVDGAGIRVEAALFDSLDARLRDRVADQVK